jgi:hypothetical protein
MKKLINMIGKILVPFELYQSIEKLNELYNLLHDLTKSYRIMYSEVNYKVNCIIFFFNASRKKYSFIKVLSLKEIYYSNEK